MPSAQATHIDPVLTNISIEYTNNELIAKLLFPVLPVAYPAGKFIRFSSGNAFKVGRSLIGPNSQVPKVDWASNSPTTPSTTTAGARPFPRSASNGQPSVVGQVEDLLVYSTKFVKNQTLLEYEELAAAVATDPDNYGANTTAPLPNGTPAAARRSPTSRPPSLPWANGRTR